jgi:hypothetical protein
MVHLMSELLQPSTARTPAEVKQAHQELLKRSLGGGSFRKMERI